MKAEPGKLILVTLEQLRPFDLNPRLTRNKHYDDIKESVRQRGLDHLLQVTRRPGESEYIISSGGNTRLAILNELWLETHDKKYWELHCLYREWEEGQSVEEGNLRCLLGHLVENDKRGELIFIERALAVKKVIQLNQQINQSCTQKELARMLSAAGYSVSQSQLSVMSGAILFLLPDIPELLYGGMTRRTIEKILSLRAGAEKFWERHCRALSPETERQLPIFNDVFQMALIPFGGEDAAFSLENLQDELNGLISKYLNVSFDLVALETDPGNLKRIALMGEPEPVLPDINEQRHVDPKYQRTSPGNDPKRPEAPPNEVHTPLAGPENSVVLSSEPPPVSAQLSGAAPDVILPQLPADHQTPTAEKNAQPVHLHQNTQPVLHDTASAFRYPDNDPQFSTPEALASIIDQAAWELAGQAGLEFLVTQTESGVFDIAQPEGELDNEGKIYWQMLAFLAGKLPGSAAVWRQILLGTEKAPAGINDTSLEQLFILVSHIRRLYATQHGANQ